MPSEGAQWVDCPLIGQPFENVEDVQLDQSAATIVDGIPVIVEGKIHIVKRPGLQSYLDLGTNAPIDGLYWWDKQRVVLAVSAGRVWKITDSSGTKSELTGSSALRSSSLVKFADDGTKAVMANGGQMVHTDLSTLTTMADGDAPTAVSHVAFLDTYILATVGNTNRVQFSNINDLTAWTSTDYFSAESDPDNVVAMAVGFQEIIVLGRQSVEFWYNDGQSPFSRISGTVQPYGTEAPNSLALIGNTWIWLAHTRQLVTMQGRAVTPVSTPYDRVLQEYVSIDDAVGYAVSIGGYPIYVLNFPTARQTLAYNYVTGQWHKWGYWDTERGEYQRYRGQSYCYARSWNQHLVGDHANGIIYKADRHYFTDNGNPIRTLLRTGHQSYGTEATKRSNIFRVRCKRGLGNADVAEPKLMYRRRVNNSQHWSQERWKSLGRVGQHELHIDFRRNGIFKTCQHEMVHSDASEFVLVGAAENIDLLGR